jgi:hypothetical protein
MYCILRFLNKGVAVIFCYFFSSALLISLSYPFICDLSYFLSLEITSTHATSVLYGCLLEAWRILADVLYGRLSVNH